MMGPGDDGSEDVCRAVADREFVAAGVDSAPLLQAREAAMKDVAVPVIVAVVADGPAASGAASEAVADLLRRLRNDGLDTASRRCRPITRDEYALLPRVPARELPTGLAARHDEGGAAGEDLAW